MFSLIEIYWYFSSGGVVVDELLCLPKYLNAFFMSEEIFIINDPFNGIYDCVKKFQTELFHNSILFDDIIFRRGKNQLQYRYFFPFVLWLLLFSSWPFRQHFKWFDFSFDASGTVNANRNGRHSWNWFDVFLFCLQFVSHTQHKCKYDRGKWRSLYRAMALLLLCTEP